MTFTLICDRYYADLIMRRTGYRFYRYQLGLTKWWFSTGKDSNATR